MALPFAIYDKIATDKGCKVFEDQLNRIDRLTRLERIGKTQDTTQALA